MWEYIRIGKASKPCLFSYGCLLCKYPSQPIWELVLPDVQGVCTGAAAVGADIADIVIQGAPTVTSTDYVVIRAIRV
jgi:hypothetical protein